MGIRTDIDIGQYIFILSDAFIDVGTVVGKGAFIGPNSSLRDHVEVGKEAIIGMGSVVVSSVPENTIFVGNPAKKASKNTRKVVFQK